MRTKQTARLSTGGDASRISLRQAASNAPANLAADPGPPIRQPTLDLQVGVHCIIKDLRHDCHFYKALFYVPKWRENLGVQ